MATNAANPLPPLKDWIHQIAFLTSAAQSADLPAFGAGEVAIAGRSNAGKSSALNYICNRRRLAFSSKTPGRTQLINLFTLQWQGEELGRLVDLPGYGYAAVEKATKARWQRELALYLESRLSLVALIVVMDIRHPFSDLDIQLLQWFGRRQQPVHVLLTKADKLTRNEQAKALSQAGKIIGQHQQDWGGQVSVSLFSATAKIGRNDVMQKLQAWWHLGEPADQETGKKNPAKRFAG